jgi:hypothetical protein
MNIGSVSSPADHQFAAQARLVNQYLSQQTSSPVPGQPTAASGPQQPGANAANPEVREKFDAFVGQSFYGQLLHEMHKTVGKSHYFNGGRAEEAFQGQLDQVLSEKMAKANASSFTGPMYDLFSAEIQSAHRR